MELGAQSLASYNHLAFQTVAHENHGIHFALEHVVIRGGIALDLDILRANHDDHRIACFHLGVQKAAQNAASSFHLALAFTAGGGFDTTFDKVREADEV